MMLILIWGGALLSVFGLIGLLFSMYKVAKAKKNSTSDQELRESIKAAIGVSSSVAVGEVSS